MIFTRRFLIILFFLATVTSSPAGVRGQMKRVSTSSGNSISQNQQNQEIQLGGVLIVFRKWPGKKEKQKILLEIKKAELGKAERVSKPKMWSFRWLNSGNNSLKNFLSFKTALEVCKKLERLHSIKYCRLEFIPILFKGFSQNDSLFQRAETTRRAETGGVETEESCKEKIFGKDSSSSFPRRDAFWGQKMIGADLAKEEMEGINNLPSDSQNLLSVFDGSINVGSGTHKELVQNVAVGQGKQSVSEPADVETNFYNYKRMQEYVSGFENRYRRCEKQGSRRSCRNTHYPAIANLSFGIIDSEKFTGDLKNLYENDKSQLESGGPFNSQLLGKVVYSSEDRRELTDLLRALDENFRSPTPFYLKQDQAVERMNERGTLIVYAAGNKGNRPIQPYTKKAAGYGAIVVGAVNSMGNRADFSQQGESVFITAPGENVTVANDRGDFSKEDGTSISAPMVSGSLRNFILGSGYRLNSDEAKAVMRETAIPHNAGPGNGVGIVNAYKVALVGKRLHRICGNDDRCKSQVIKDRGKSLYRFKRTKGLLEKVEMFFPQCSSRGNGALTILCNRNCDEKARVLRQLRQEFLLNPQDSVMANYLACIYSSHGYEETAGFYLRGGNYTHLQQALRCHGLPKNQQGDQTDSTLKRSQSIK